MANSLTGSVRRELTSTLVKNLHKEQIFAKITDGKFLSGLKFGESYAVASADAVNIGDYTGAAITRQKATDSKTSVLIDQQKYFDVGLDEPDAQQAEATIRDYIDEGKYSLADAMDSYIATTLETGAGTTAADDALLGTSATPIVVTDANVLDYISRFAINLKKNNATIANCSLTVTPTLATYIQTARAGAGSDAGTSEQKTGWIDKIYGLNIYESNNLPVGTDTAGNAVLAFEKRALKWRDSMKPMSQYQPDDTFEDAVKALHVYGAKVITAIDKVVVRGYAK